MKIVVIADAALRAELESKALPEGWSYVWVESPEDFRGQGNASLYMDLCFAPDPVRKQQLESLLPTPVIINAVVQTILEIGYPFIRINAWPGFLGRTVHELVVPDAGTGEKIGALYETLGWKYKLTPDIPGMISSRVLAMIINEAYYTLQEGVSSKEEIDIAMKLGTNYPMGPFEWSKKIGLEKIDQLLTVLEAEDGRYTVSPALKQELVTIK